MDYPYQRSIVSEDKLGRIKCYNKKIGVYNSGKHPAACVTWVLSMFLYCTTGSDIWEID